MSAPLVETENLKVHFPVRRGVLARPVGAVKAVDGVSIAVHEGQTTGLVGESGCGKSTLAKAMVRLLEPTAGTIRCAGQDITHLSQRALRPLRRNFQMIFQDPAESLDPRMSIGSILEEPFIIHRLGNRRQRREWVGELLQRVGLPAAAAERYPFEFSGGQRQRIGIARALALKPKWLVCDEPVSALDLSVQSAILNLLVELQQEFGLGYLFISHDLSVVRHVSDYVAIMYLGKIVEYASASDIFERPRHAYTKALLAAVPQPVPGQRRSRVLLEGDVPSPIDPPPGSAFGHRLGHPRYPETIGMDLSLKEISPGHWVSPDPCALEADDYATLTAKMRHD